MECVGEIDMWHKGRDCSDGIGIGIGIGTGKVVVVAVKVSREIPKRALLWALTHVAQPGDCFKLLVIPAHHSSIKKYLGLSRLTSDCTTGHGRSLPGVSSEQKEDIADSCSRMMLQLRDVYDTKKIKISVKIVSASPCGVVAAEAKRTKSNWVILDKLKHEKKCCMEQLQCNVVVMKRSQAKVLRLNLVGPPNMEPQEARQLPYELKNFREYLKSKHDQVNVATPTSSPDQESPLTATDVGTTSISSSDIGTSPLSLTGVYGCLKKEHRHISGVDRGLEESESDTDSLKLDPPSSSEPQRPKNKARTSTYEALMNKLSRLDQEPDIGVVKHKLDTKLSRSVRDAFSFSRKVVAGPPPLCSVCQHKGPAFGNPPRWFKYAELELATNGFSQKNFLAEGGYGSVHRGVLPDGQVIAVKQYKLASSQGDREFCSEVEVLSCAQHRNVVMLIGFCVDGGRRLLVYEYICNGSLDSHLYGCNRNSLTWSARQKIAVGAARGLRYLHEECRVGCIVHRDLRPNNILITHDFQPLVGDFGLARWQPDGDTGVETRVIGTFGYVAPEYAQSGQITEKADVYSFGVVLVELVTGRKAMDINRPRGQQCLTEWARPLLEKRDILELVDPRLDDCYSEQEIRAMLQCASLCIRRNPQSRPRMSQVLRVLEGDIANLEA